MARRIFTLVVCVLFPMLTPAADEAGKKEAVRELDVKALRRDFPRGKIDMPTVIASVEELAKAFPEEEAQTRLKKEVDFGKQKLLFFAWSGSGGDRLGFKTEAGKKELEVTFQYQRGLTRDLRGHVRLYVMPKDATWKMAGK